MRKIFSLAAGLLLLALAPARADEIESAYTKIDLKKCPLIDKNDDEGPWALWRCDGYEGRPVFVMEGDLRFFIWFDERETNERIRDQTLAPFNNLGKGVLEWRLRRGPQGVAEPFATIIRYYTAREGKPEGQVLVVSQIKPGATCHIAYVDALANRDANVLAREAADEYAGTFDCGNEPMVIGKSGISR